MWFSVACFGVRVSVTFHLMFVHIILSSVWVAVWPPFGKELPARLTICSLCILTICNFIFFSFCFHGGILVLIAPVPSHCILVTFSHISISYSQILLFRH